MDRNPTPPPVFHFGPQSPGDLSPEWQKVVDDAVQAFLEGFDRDYRAAISKRNKLPSAEK